MNLNKLAEDLLYNVKIEKDTKEIRQHLEACSLKELSHQLNNDENKKAFWINVYNAYYQILRKEQNIKKPDIYKKKLFKIAQTSLSLDDIEHGVLRKNKYKYSLGFFNRLWRSTFIKKHQVNTLDYRIHFALNCGAKSCPPIAFYNSENINNQLDIATQSFLEAESDFDYHTKTVKTTALFKWFYADFGGTKGIKKIYKEQLDKDISNYKIQYKDYSWEDDLDNFVK